MKPPRWVPANGRRTQASLGLVCSSTVFALLLSGCGEEERAPLLPIQDPPGSGQPCEQAEPTNPFFHTELIPDIEYWDCPPPLSGSGSMSFIESRGTSAVVTGSEARFSLSWEGEGNLDGREVIVWLTPGTRGFYAFPAPSDSNPQEIELLMASEMEGGDYQVAFGISDGRDENNKPLLGRVFRSPLHVIQVGSGDIQINLNWPSILDLDLYAVEPGGTVENKGVIYWSNKTSPRGGELDLDSYAGCKNVDDDRGRGNENIYWPIGSAPHGTYQVEVDLFRDGAAQTASPNECDLIDAEHPGDYRVTIVRAGGDVSSFTGTYVAGDANQHRIVTTFEY
ncbi:MAG TPA: hypothetical protein VJU61_02550 [Polyangiaceae bacterium]|nr:hypothetical protein [Polyangiaceae bacterium]